MKTSYSTGQTDIVLTPSELGMAGNYLELLERVGYDTDRLGLVEPSGAAGIQLVPDHKSNPTHVFEIDGVSYSALEGLNKTADRNADIANTITSAIGKANYIYSCIVAQEPDVGSIDIIEQINNYAETLLVNHLGLSPATKQDIDRENKTLVNTITFVNNNVAIEYSALELITFDMVELLLPVPYSHVEVLVITTRLKELLGEYMVVAPRVLKDGVEYINDLKELKQSIVNIDMVNIAKDALLAIYHRNYLYDRAAISDNAISQTYIMGDDVVLGNDLINAIVDIDADIHEYNEVVHSGEGYTSDLLTELSSIDTNEIDELFEVLDTVQTPDISQVSEVLSSKVNSAVSYDGTQLNKLGVPVTEEQKEYYKNKVDEMEMYEENVEETEETKIVKEEEVNIAVPTIVEKALNKIDEGLIELLGSRLSNDSDNEINIMLTNRVKALEMANSNLVKDITTLSTKVASNRNTISNMSNDIASLKQLIIKMDEKMSESEADQYAGKHYGEDGIPVDYVATKVEEVEQDEMVESTEELVDALQVMTMATTKLSTSSLIKPLDQMIQMLGVEHIDTTDIIFDTPFLYVTNVDEESKAKLLEEMGKVVPTMSNELTLSQVYAHIALELKVY